MDDLLNPESQKKQKGRKGKKQDHFNYEDANENTDKVTQGSIADSKNKKSLFA